MINWMGRFLASIILMTLGIFVIIQAEKYATIIAVCTGGSIMTLGFLLLPFFHLEFRKKTIDKELKIE